MRISDWSSDVCSSDLIVFWIIFLVALVGALGILRIDGVTGPLSGMLNTLVPALVLGVVAWLVATVVRGVVHKVLGATSLDETLVDADQPQPPPLSRTMGAEHHSLVFLLLLPAVASPPAPAAHPDPPA